MFGKFKKQQLVLMFLGTALAAVLLFIPKPELIKYESANMVSEGVYWDGLGSSGMLFDANASFVKIDKDTNHLHICYGAKETSNCQQYRIIENQGLAGAISRIF